jgi:hypothetical protein
MSSSATARETAVCPAWCVKHGAPDHSPIWHASEGSRLDLPSSADSSFRESLEVRTARYPLDDSASSDWESAVELAHHFEGRYRVIRLTPDTARRLTELLMRATELAESLDGRTPDSAAGG